MHKLTVVPSQTSYAVNDGVETVSTRLDGGASRRRRDIIGATSRVNVTWRLNRTKYEYIKAFHNTTQRGALPFLIELIVDKATLTEHVAYFAPGTFRLSNVSGLSYTVVAQLDVTPEVRNEIMDEVIVSLYNEYQENIEQALAELERLTNVTIPTNVGV